jgi:ABC-type xylose transport system permease subunit
MPYLKTPTLPPIATLGPLFALLLAVIFFATQSDRFLSVQNFSLILQQVMVVGTIAIGQTLIILTAGIDLSCGMVMALGGIVMTKLAVANGMNAYLAIVCGLLVCMAFGFVNGMLVTRIKLPPFIVTLGTMNIAFAITQLYSGAQTITELPAEQTFFGSTVAIGSAASLNCANAAGCTLGAELMAQIAGNATENPWAICINVDNVTQYCPWVGQISAARGIFVTENTRYNFAVAYGAHTMQMVLYSAGNSTLGAYEADYRLYKP